MAKIKSADLLAAEKRPLRDRLLVAAVARNGHPLQPYPKDAPAENIAAALETLRKDGLVHGPAHEPNLTLAGRDLARALADQAAA